jgi:hypothetical protein
MAELGRVLIKASDYYRLPDYKQHDLIQLIDGEVIISTPPTSRHQAVVGAIFFS